MTIVRLGLPLLLVVVGVTLIVVGGEQADGAGVTIAGCAVIVWLLNLLFRFSERERGDRDREEAARDFYRQHGRWPDEE